VRRTVLLIGLCLASRPARGAVEADLAAVTAALPACDPVRAHCIAIQLHVAADAEGGGLIAQPGKAHRAAEGSTRPRKAQPAPSSSSRSSSMPR